MRTRIVGVCLAWLVCFAAQAAGPAVTVEHAWARATPPGAANGAAFMVLVNQGPRDTALVRAKSDAARAVELHTHRVEDGVARMRPVPDIPVAAGGRTELRPGGLHIMLIGLKAPLVDGAQLPMTLDFADGSELRVVLPIRRGDHAER